MIIELDLPSPSNKIIQAIYRISDAASLELNLKAMHDKVQEYTRNSVSRKFIENDEELNTLAQNEFAHLFEEKFISAAGIIKNIQNDQYACWPPHADRVRIFALNYYIKEGGKYVTTVTYKNHIDYRAGPGTGAVFRYKDIAIDKTYHLKMDNWYALDVRQVHSIENIENTRLIFTLSFHNITCNEFIKKYTDYLRKLY